MFGKMQRRMQDNNHLNISTSNTINLDAKYPGSFGGPLIEKSNNSFAIPTRPNFKISLQTADGQR